MADSSRSSGRSAAPAGVTGNGRRASMPPTGSGRRQPVQPAQPEYAVEAPAPAQQPAPRPRSSRQPAMPPEPVEEAALVEVPEPQPPAPAAHPRAATLGSRSARGGVSVRKKVRGVGKELMICFGIIGLLAVAAVVVFFIQRSHNRVILDEIERQKRLFENNMTLGFDTYQRAENAGKLFVMKGEAATDDQLFGPFKNDDKIYNVIYDRLYKDRKNKDQREQRAMFRDRLKIESIERVPGREENGVSVTYAFAEDRTIPLVIAKKFTKPVQGDTANLGGTITIIAKAESDKHFESAKAFKAVPDKDKTEKTESKE